LSEEFWFGLATIDQTVPFQDSTTV
jgi:hypothetical protein